MRTMQGLAPHAVPWLQRSVRCRAGWFIPRKALPDTGAVQLSQLPSPAEGPLLCTAASLMAGVVEGLFY